jgi:phage repressor protein C with HTH and peptisase S24 domain
VLERYGGGKIIIQDFEMRMEKNSHKVVAESVKECVLSLKEDYKMDTNYESKLKFESENSAIIGTVKFEKSQGYITAEIWSRFKGLQDYECVRKIVEKKLKNFKRKKSFPSLIAASEGVVKKPNVKSKPKQPDFPDVWIDIPKEKKKEKTTNVWERKVVK